jgi:riboflavin kinase/FMN adenylyltransferase
MQPSSMLLITDLNDIPTLGRPCGLTIGSFDGVHLGHQALLKHLRAKLPPNSILSILTFSNHPSHLFTPHSPTLLISPPLQKVKHFENYGADLVILIPFDAAFAGTSFEKFLRHMKESLGFSYLSLGEGATFGKNKEGNEANVKLLAKEIGFEVDYLPKYLVNGTPVSSGRVRALIAQFKSALDVPIPSWDV